VFNLVDPANPFEVLHYDTYLPNHHSSYKGAWGVYPFWNTQSYAFSSILVSDMQTGLYVFSGSFPLAINNLDPATSLVFPNPAKNQFTITNESATSIMLYEVFGKKVLQQDLCSGKTIKRRNLSSGMYFYCLKNKKGIIEKGKVIFE
jgi:hypothetical protein